MKSLEDVSQLEGTAQNEMARAFRAMLEGEGQREEARLEAEQKDKLERSRAAVAADETIAEQVKKLAKSLKRRKDKTPRVDDLEPIARSLSKHYKQGRSWRKWLDAAEAMAHEHTSHLGETNGVYTPTDAELRKAIFRYSLEQASPAMKGHIQHLCSCWERYNAEFFDSRLAPPVLALEEPGPSTCYGEFSPVSCFGGSGQIMIRPSLLVGTLQDFRQGNKNKEGLRRFTEYVLLHEMIHQWQVEVAGTPPGEFHNYGGHGSTFSHKANEIGEKFGLPPVRLRNKKSHSGKTKHLPNPSHWPHCVCQPEYFLGAYVPFSPDEDAKLLEDLARILRRHDIGKVERVAREIWQRMQEAEERTS